MHPTRTTVLSSMPPLDFRETYPGVDESVSAVRHDLERCLAPLCLPGLTDDAVLCASELATNAVRHVAHNEERAVYRVVAVLCHRQGRVILRLEVHDDAAADFPAWPPSPAVSERATSGRGLPIVDALSVSCGFAQDPGSGKYVWCELDTGCDAGPNCP